MTKHYKDLSRRALIKLGSDYDKENDEALINYLKDHNDEYESVRDVEKIIEKSDMICQTLKCNSSVLKDIAAKESGKILDSVIDAITSISAETEKIVGNLSENLE